MGRTPCCDDKQRVNKGAWSADEDEVLVHCVETHGPRKWRDIAQRAGLNRCGKSCRLRWLNYLRPDIKRGNISADEDDLILRLHKLLGNRWNLIAGRLPERTGNEIKNYWNSTLSKRLLEQAPQNHSDAHDHVHHQHVEKLSNNFKQAEDTIYMGDQNKAIRTKSFDHTEDVIISSTIVLDDRSTTIDDSHHHEVENAISSSSVIVLPDLHRQELLNSSSTFDVDLAMYLSNELKSSDVLAADGVGALSPLDNHGTYELLEDWKFMEDALLRSEYWQANHHEPFQPSDENYVDLNALQLF